MPYELIYTSAEKGLRPGTRGFCTVACTDGITPNMVMQLEQLSAYRHIITPTSPDNPEVHSHLIIPINGLTWHILSRIADAGLDYTRRSNKIAHHMILSESEVRQLGSIGPIEILEREDLFCRSWDQPPQVLPFKDLPACQPANPEICQQWEEIYGDSGWGGVLAGSFERKLPVCIAFDPKQKRLPLLRESLALLPAASRWNISFCTYYTKYPPSINCQCKCVLSGSTEEAQVRAIPYTVFIDLSRQGGSVPDLEPSMQAWVELARSGKREQIETSFTSTQNTIPNDRFDSVFYNDDQNFNFQEIDELKGSSRIPPSMRMYSQSNSQNSGFENIQASENSIYGFSPDSFQNQKTEPIPQYVSIGSTDNSIPLGYKRKKSTFKNKLYIFGSIILLLILGSVFGVAWKLKDQTPQTQKKTTTSTIKELNHSDLSNSDLQKPVQKKTSGGKSQVLSLSSEEEKKTTPEKTDPNSIHKKQVKAKKENDPPKDPVPGTKTSPVPKTDSQKEPEKNKKIPPEKIENSPASNSKSQEEPKWINEAKKVLDPVKKFTLTFKEIREITHDSVKTILSEKEMETINNFLEHEKLTLKIEWKPLLKYTFDRGKNEAVFQIKKEEKEVEIKDKGKNKEITWIVNRHDVNKQKDREQDCKLIELAFHKEGTLKLKNKTRLFEHYALCLSNIEWYLVDTKDKGKSTKIFQTQWLKPSSDNLGSGLSELFKKGCGENFLFAPMKDKENWELHSTIRILKENGENDMGFQKAVEEKISASEIKYERIYLQSGSGDRFILFEEKSNEEDQKPK